MGVMDVRAILKMLINRYLGKNLGCNQTYTHDSLQTISFIIVIAELFQVNLLDDFIRFLRKNCRFVKITFKELIIIRLSLA